MSVGIFDARTISVPIDLRRMYVDIRRLEIELVCAFLGKSLPDPDEQAKMRRPHLVMWSGTVPFLDVRNVLDELNDIKSSYLGELKAHEVATRGEDRPTGAFPGISDQSMSPPFFVTRAGRVPFDASMTPQAFAVIEDDPATRVTLSETRAWRVGDHDADDAVAYLETMAEQHQAEIERTPDPDRIRCLLSAWFGVRVGIHALPAIAEMVQMQTGHPLAFRMSSGMRRQYRARFSGEERAGITFSIPNVAIVRVSPEIARPAPAHKRDRAAVMKLLHLWGRLGLFVTARDDAMDRMLAEIIAEASDHVRASLSPGLRKALVEIEGV